MVVFMRGNVPRATDGLTLLFSLVAACGNLWIAFRLHRLGSRR